MINRLICVAVIIEKRQVKTACHGGDSKDKLGILKPVGRKTTIPDHGNKANKPSPTPITKKILYKKIKHDIIVSL